MTKEPKDLTELEQYLKKISIDDLMLLQKDRRSSKNLEGGPQISGKLAHSGQPTKGHSVPTAILEDKQRVFGNGSFEKQGANYSDVKDLIENKPLKDSLLHSLKKEAMDHLVDANKKNFKIDWRNKAYQLRKELISNRMDEVEAQHWT